MNPEFLIFHPEKPIAVGLIRQTSRESKLVSYNYKKDYELLSEVKIEYSEINFSYQNPIQYFGYVCKNNNWIEYRDWETLELIHQFKENSVYNLTTSSDGQQFVYTSGDEYFLYSIENGKLVKKMERPWGEVGSVIRFAKDNTMIISGQRNEDQAQLWIDDIESLIKDECIQKGPDRENFNYDDWYDIKPKTSVKLKHDYMDVKGIDVSTNEKKIVFLESCDEEVYISLATMGGRLSWREEFEIPENEIPNIDDESTEYYIPEDIYFINNDKEIIAKFYGQNLIILDTKKGRLLGQHKIKGRLAQDSQGNIWLVHPEKPPQLLDIGSLKNMVDVTSVMPHPMICHPTQQIAVGITDRAVLAKLDIENDFKILNSMELKSSNITLLKPNNEEFFAIHFKYHNEVSIYRWDTLEEIKTIKYAEHFSKKELKQINHVQVSPDFTKIALAITRDDYKFVQLVAINEQTSQRIILKYEISCILLCDEEIYITADSYNQNQLLCRYQLDGINYQLLNEMKMKFHGYACVIKLLGDNPFILFNSWLKNDEHNSYSCKHNKIYDKLFRGGCILFKFDQNFNEIARYNSVFVEHNDEPDYALQISRNHKIAYLFMDHNVWIHDMESDKMIQFEEFKKCGLSLDSKDNAWITRPKKKPILYS